MTQLRLSVARVKRWRHQDKSITAGQDFVRFLRLKNFERTHGELIARIEKCDSRRQIMSLIYDYKCYDLQ